MPMMFHPFKAPHRTIRVCCAALCFAATGSPALHGAELPAPYMAEYEARTSGMKATAYRTLEQDGEQFTLSNSLALKLMGASVGEMVERTEFRHDGGIVPEFYEYVQTGIGRRSESVTFDWSKQQAAADDDGDESVLALQPQTQDKLSFTVQLGMDLAALPADSLTEGKSFSYQVVDGDEIEEQRYSIAGREVVSTPLGEIETLRLERLRAPDSRRRTTFWLSTEREFLLVKLEQVSSSGATTELLLQSVTQPDAPAP